MRIGQLAQLNEVAYGSDFLYTTSRLYGFFCLKSILINNLFNSFFSSSDSLIPLSNANSKIIRNLIKFCNSSKESFG